MQAFRSRWPWLSTRSLHVAQVQSARRSFVNRAALSTTRTAATMERAQAVLDYWFGPSHKLLRKDYFEEDKTKIWFGGGPEVDKYITANFKADVEKVASGEYESWLESPEPLNGLAGVILMDQFTRNIYRGSPQAFALDPKAREWARQMLDSGKADSLPHMLRTFLLLPFMHSEDLPDQQRCVELYRAEAAAAEAGLGSDSAVAKMLKSYISYAVQHKEVVEQWGRFPHRNAVLGRADTEEEARGLAEGTIKKFG